MLLIETKMLANINQRQSWTDGTIAGLFSRQVRDTGIVGVPRVIPPFSPHPSRVHNSSTKKEQREREQFSYLCAMECHTSHFLHRLGRTVLDDRPLGNVCSMSFR